ncbi:helicase-related protein [Halalkalibacter krulwichiae]|uniref:Ski2-like helicase n=1 Tax=Halalkalibacter krulwichiae TaxID=199441 RepID=A0A1X9MDF5_9BACI|nr:helicase-related protein [Halalkalibacter krulwichiae]ARK30580.1 ski2-like helicase [Halalkalibacter krulwichiae]
MTKLMTVYPQAIEHTKRKVLDDIDRYLEVLDKLPNYEQYKTDRRNYLEQIWLNVWLNKVTSSISKKEKKAILAQHNYDVDGIDRKILNRLFRNEMRNFEPFNVIEWLDQTFRTDDNWRKKYKTATERYKKFLIEEAKAQKRFEFQKDVETIINKLMKEEEINIYLYLRHKVSRKLSRDFTTKPKYRMIETIKIEEKLEKIGPFNSSDYFTVSKFLDELTGEVHRAYYWEYETYFNSYYTFVEDELVNYIGELLFTQFTNEITTKYYEIYNDNLSPSKVKGLVELTVTPWRKKYFSQIQSEILADLLKLADVPYDLVVHKEIYYKDLQERERKRQEEEEAIRKKQEEEERILDDIFGREYRPSAGRSIRYVLHIGETNTGKTHHALQRMKKAQSGLYLAPLRLLALEVFDKLNGEGVLCTLRTGEEEKVVSGATHHSCTVEMFHEKEAYEVIVIDEAQMIADKDRGFSWYKAITKANAKEVHIIGSRNVEKMTLQLLGDSDIEIYDYKRDIPLKVERKEFTMNQTKKGDALVCFSRRRVLETASQLQKNGHSVSMIYGSMPPETRKKQMQRFIEGETTVIVSTDAIGMGLNLPIRRIAFLENEKFDGSRRRRLTSQEVKQIAGRAGRKGIYDVGKVAFASDIKLMKHLLQQEDDSIQTFAIAPTASVFERFQKYYRDLGTFFELWDKFESPKGTKKASLSEEKELYETIRGTEIEARLSMMDLYGFLHLPFSTKDSGLIEQWQDKMVAIIRGEELPEPQITRSSLEEMELSYKSIGLHLLFLYRLDKRTEAMYWERVREEISDGVHEYLKNDVKNLTKKCKHCGKSLEWDHAFTICDHCYALKSKKRQSHQFRNNRRKAFK